MIKVQLSVTGIASLLATLNGDITMTMGDFFVMNRSIFKHWLYLNAPSWVLVLWMTLIGDAAWEDRNFSHWKMAIPLKRGQLICTGTELGKRLKRDKQRIAYWLDKLCDLGMIRKEYIVKIQQNSRKIRRTESIVGSETAQKTEQRTGYRIMSGPETPDYRSVLGLLITIGNYDKYQLAPGSREITDGKGKGGNRRNSKRTKSITKARIAGVTELRTINKTEDQEGKHEEESISPPLSPQGEIIPYLSPSITKTKKALTPERAFEIWEAERGRLPSITVKRADKLGELLEHLNSDDHKDPEVQWTEIVRKARQCHRSHMPFMSPYFFSKDVTHIDQVMNGMYEQSFERGKYGATRVEREGRGDAEDFGFTGGRRRRITVLCGDKVSKVQ